MRKMQLVRYFKFPTDRFDFKPFFYKMIHLKKVSNCKIR
ncbi:hypothetical protein CFF8240_1733 [Campylobacter fetus subsp. fetus 82-40]|uniref:Uncharacterized protein n=1 Tax=Campylobacter fetus subsp. fetus (strain 82-40) TaxID=360106 RepID=A0RRL8_CAMFF|nr:hypothetical protein CFF8240_1733 [Campylobacter fetus subsp. fetus 82-40]